MCNDVSRGASGLLSNWSLEWKEIECRGGLLVQRSVKRAEHALSFMQVVHQGHGSCLDICQKETLVIHYSLFR